MYYFSLLKNKDKKTYRRSKRGGRNIAEEESKLGKKKKSKKNVIEK